MSKVNGKSAGVVLARRDGTVIAQNKQGLELLGPGVGQLCWNLVGGLAGAEGLPCNPGCVGRLLSRGIEHTGHSVFRLKGSAYHLWCVPVGELAACVVNPDTSTLPETWEELTPREREVLRLMAKGENTSAIAEALGVSEHTVRTHVQHMRVKFGVGTRAGLVAQGFRFGFLE